MAADEVRGLLATAESGDVGGPAVTLTREAIDTMPAGLDMDALVATRVMGWTETTMPRGTLAWRSAGGGWIARSTYRPSRDIGWAFNVARELSTSGWTWSVWGAAWPGDPHEHAQFERFDDKRKCGAWGETAALAICRAALATTTQ